MNQLGDSSFCALAVGLAFLRAVDDVQADAFRLVVVKNLNGVAVEDGDDRGGKVQREYG